MLHPKPPTITFYDIQEELAHYLSEDDIALVHLAADFARDAHQGQYRKSGEPYIQHALHTALNLAKLHADTPTVIAGVLHDVAEDTDVSFTEIQKNFGKTVATLVKGVTKLGQLKYRGVERYVENLRKMFIAMARDPRVALIKFADRQHNLETLWALEPRKQYRIALETMKIYAPIAGRLGIGNMKGALEDLAFLYLQPEEYAKTVEQSRDARKKINKSLDRLMNKTRKLLHENDITILSLHGRTKHLYSLYRKMQRYDKSIDEIYDLVALRMIVPNISDCYKTLGIIHAQWKPLKGRIKDYISMPKPNGYQSLHTTVFAVNRIVEFQIRTQEMHDEAEYGIAAHWHYKEHGNNGTVKKNTLHWLRDLQKLGKEEKDGERFLESAKENIFTNRIYVFTPKGDVIELPEGATPIDFAYHIHSDIGNKAVRATVNDMQHDLTAPVQSGDVIAIEIDKKRKGPNADWLKMVKSPSAKKHILAARKKLRNT